MKSPSFARMERRTQRVPRPVLQVFDEEDGVASFVVEEFVYQVLGEENAETSGAAAFLGADFDVADG